MADIQSSGGNIFTFAGSILGGIYTATGKIDFNLINFELLNLHLTKPEIVRIVESAAVGGFVGAVVGYFIKLILDKIFKPKSEK